MDNIKYAIKRTLNNDFFLGVSREGEPEFGRDRDRIETFPSIEEVKEYLEFADQYGNLKTVESKKEEIEEWGYFKGVFSSQSDILEVIQVVVLV